MSLSPSNVSPKDVPPKDVPPKNAIPELHSSVWYRACNAFGNALVFLAGHSLHWGRRWQWLKKRSKIEVVQAVLAVLSLVIGVLMMFLRHGNGGSVLVPLLDNTFTRPDAAADHWLGAWHLPLLTALAGLLPHQVFGAFLTAASLALIVGVMEWPVEGDPVLDNEVADSRLRFLLCLHLTGHLASVAYWGGSGFLLFLDHPGSYISAAVCSFFAFVHSWLFRRNEIEFERACGLNQRSREKTERDKDKTEREKCSSFARGMPPQTKP